MQIQISIDHAGVDKLLLVTAGLRNQLPFATSVALNNTAYAVMQAERDATSVFNTPTAYTRNAFRYTRSNKDTLTATVYPDPSRRYFPTEIFGGDRRWKPYEGFLRGLSKGALPDGQLVPTSAVIDGAGNPKRSIFKLIESNLATTGKGSIFIGTPRGGSRAPGVYQRGAKGKLVPLFLVERRPHYRPLFPMESTAQKTIAAVWPTELNKALQKALDSAR
jgi:hypothetical protein